MDLLTIFVTTFGLVFINELGDKTQIAAGTGTLANRAKVMTIFFSSAVALTAVAGVTVFAAGLIPEDFLPSIKKVGGILLAAYGGFLLAKAGNPDDDEAVTDNHVGWGLFFSHFMIVFIAELGDKTQFATLAVAIDNQSHLLLVFAASASALVAVTGITVWGVTKVPPHWIKNVQRFGALLMVAYGAYMILNP